MEHGKTFLDAWSKYLSKEDLSVIAHYVTALLEKKSLDYVLVISGDRGSGKSALYNDIRFIGNVDTIASLESLHYDYHAGNFPKVQRRRMLYTNNQIAEIDAFVNLENDLESVGRGDDKKMMEIADRINSLIVNFMENKPEPMGCLGDTTLQNYKYRNLVVVLNPTDLSEYFIQKMFDGNIKTKTIHLKHNFCNNE